MKQIRFVLFFLVLLSSTPLFASLSKPALNYPIDGSTSYYRQFTIGIYTITGIDIYRFQADTSPNFNSPLLMDSSRNTYYFFASPQYPLGSTVYVRGKVYSATDSSDWSDVHSVYISEKLKLTKPADQTNAAFDYFSWYNVGAQKYTISIDSSAHFNSPMLFEKDFQNLVNTRFIWDSFYFNQKYYWKVTAYVDNDTMYSDTWSFTHNSPSEILFPPAGQNWGGRTATVAMKWGDAGMAKVEYQVSTDPSFTTIDRHSEVSSYENEWDTAFQMDWDTKYYSRIRFLTKADTLPWAIGGNQTTLKPRFTDPYNGKTINFSGDVLKLYGDYDHVDTFQLQVDTNANFNTAFIDTFITNLSYSFKPEWLAKTYHIRVRGVHPKDTSDWYSRYIQTADINYYGLWTIPNDKSVDNDLEFTLQFSSVINNIPYIEVELDTSPDFTSDFYMTFSGDYFSGSPVVLNDLLFGATYYYRFKIGDYTDTSEWSSLRTFSTWGGPIKYDYPPNTARNWSMNNYLIIKKPGLVDGIKYYLWELDTITSFNSPVLRSKLDTNTLEFKPFELGYDYLGTEYYWRVAAAHDKDTSAWGPIWNYQTHTTFLNKPLNGSADLNTSVTLEWSGNSSLQGYYVLIDTSPDFHAAWIHIADEFQMSYTVNNLLNGKTYYWTVLPYNEIDTGKAYAVFTFTVKDIPALTKPQLYTPNNYKTNLDYNSISFSWKSYPETGITYNLQISKSETFSSLLYDKNQSKTSASITGFDPGTKYYWRVRYRRSSIDLGPWSNTYQFTTKVNTGVMQQNEDEDYFLYPNPIQDELFIESSKEAQISIYTAEGKNIYSGKIYSGLNPVNTSNWSRGVYYLHIQVDHKKIIKQIIK
jgi:hypothetical protein